MPVIVGQAKHVEIPVDSCLLSGELTVPVGACGIVLFAHGSGSSRLSPRNRAVARLLVERGLGTVLMDLLTEAEAGDRGNVFDVTLLAGRLGQAVRWLRGLADVAALPIGIFGASTGAAAALVAAAELRGDVRAVVSRGGRPDLAGEDLDAVRCPVLLLVGGRDDVVLELNREAAERLQCPHALEVVPGATHLFEEPGALDTVAEAAARFFLSSFEEEVPRP